MLSLPTDVVLSMGSYTPLEEPSSDVTGIRAFLRRIAQRSWVFLPFATTCSHIKITVISNYDHIQYCCGTFE